MAQFVKVASGGQDGQLLFELCDFVKVVCGPDNMTKRRLGGTFIEAVASMRFTTVTANPLLQTAILKAQATCPNRFVIDGVCKLLKPKDVQNTARHKSVAQVEKAMSQVRGIVLQGVKDRRRAVKMLGLFDVRVILWMTSKSELISRRKFSGLDEIISDFLLSIDSDDSLIEVRARLVAFGYTFSKDVDDPPAVAESASAPSSSLATISEQHDAAMALKALKIEVGCHIESAKPEHAGDVFLIKAITDEEVFAVKVGEHATMQYPLKRIQHLCGDASKLGASIGRLSAATQSAKFCDGGMRPWCGSAPGGAFECICLIGCGSVPWCGTQSRCLHRARRRAL